MHCTETEQVPAGATWRIAMVCLACCAASFYNVAFCRTPARAYTRSSSDQCRRACSANHSCGSENVLRKQIGTVVTTDMRKSRTCANDPSNDAADALKADATADDMHWWRWRACQPCASVVITDRLDHAGENAREHGKDGRRAAQHGLNRDGKQAIRTCLTEFGLYDTDYRNCKHGYHSASRLGNLASR